jgi:hypothetical protein
MKAVQKVHCPNCGSSAEKIYLSEQNLISLSCSSCDYLIIHCPDSAKVLEVYAPGLKMSR